MRTGGEERVRIRQRKVSGNKSQWDGEEGKDKGEKWRGKQDVLKKLGI